MRSIKWGWAGAVVMALVLTACGGSSSSGNSITMPSDTELCASVGVQAKIFNGSDCTDSSSTPIVQLLMLQSGETYSCSGVMLTSTKVLTAGHCFPSDTTRAAAIVLDASGSASLVYATGWVNHPDYASGDSGILYDVGVVTLNAGMPNPSMPLLVSDASKKGDAVYIAGWGLPSTDFAVGYTQLSKVTELQLQVDFDGDLSNTCSGDSGGPVYRSVNGVQGVVGLTSTGTSSECGGSELSLFTNTQAPSILSFVRGQAPGVGEI